jgi:hypothetical protein
MLSRSRAIATNWERNGHQRAAIGRTLCFNLAPVPGHNLPTDVKAQSNSASGATLQFVRLVEGLEDMRQTFRRDTEPMIPYGNPRCLRIHRRERNHDFAASRTVPPPVGRSVSY